MWRHILQTVVEFAITGMLVAVCLLILGSFVTSDMPKIMDAIDWSVTLIWPGGRMIGAWGAAPNPRLLHIMYAESVIVNGLSYACIGCIVALVRRPLHLFVKESK